MIRKILIVCFVLALSVVGKSISAQTAYLYSEVDSVNIGESFNIKLEFSGFSEEDILTIDWDTLDLLEHRSLVDSQLYDIDFDLSLGNFKGADYRFDSEELKWEKDVQSSPPSFYNNFEWTVWELCILGIPGPKVTLKNGQSFELAPRYIYVKDPLLGQVEQLAPSESILRDTYTFVDLLKEYVWWILGIFGLVILLILSFRWYKKRQERVVPEPEPELPEPEHVIPAHIIALEKLSNLRSTTQSYEGKDKAFVSELTEIIREYIENRFGVRALEMTTSEITDALKKEVLSAKQIGKLQNTLNVSDLIKFAKAQADANMFDEFVDEAIDLVQETKEEEEETL